MVGSLDDLDELERTALDGTINLSLLQQLAQDYPSVRYLIALNPAAYPDLLEWLSQLGDPQIDHALAQRAAVLAGQPYQPFDAAAPEPAAAPLVLNPAVLNTAEGNPNPTALADQDPPELKTMAVSGPIYTDVPSQPAPNAVESTPRETPVVLTTASTTTSEDEEEETTDPTRRIRVLGILLALAVVGILAATLLAFYFRFMNSHPIINTTTEAKPSPVPTKTVTATPTPPLTVPKPTITPSQNPTPTPTVTKSPTSDPLAPPAGAQRISSFVSADGNIKCQLAAGGMDCIINRSDLETNCVGQEQSAYQLSLSSGHEIMAACVTPHLLDAQATMTDGQSTTVSPFACKLSAGGTEVKCWNTTSGEGFKLSKDSWIRRDSGTTLPK